MQKRLVVLNILHNYISTSFLFDLCACVQKEKLVKFITRRLFFSQIIMVFFFSRSILNTRCRICRRKTDPENMLLCDGCDRGHHLYCLKPKLKKIPSGDWFCDECKPKERVKSPKKKARRVFEAEPEPEAAEDDNDEDEEESGVNICNLLPRPW